MYTPLYVKTNYSLLSSLIKIDDLIGFCLQHNIKSIAITDSNLFGMMEFYKKCNKNSIHPVIGLEITLENSIILLYAKNYKGYQSLIKLSTIQSERQVTIDDIKNNSQEILCIIPFEYKELLNTIRNIVSEIYLGYKNKEEERIVRLDTKNVVFLREVQYIKKEEEPYLKYLFMIRDGKTIADFIEYDTENKELELDNIYNYSSNEGLFETTEFSRKCNFEFPKSELLLSIFDTKDKGTPIEYLTSLTQTGLLKRLNNQVPKEYQTRLAYELEIIEKMGFSNYFLVVYDFIKYAKKNHILVGPGRGSAAGSLVSYSLGITEIDPLEYDLLFERFLNP